MGFKKTEKGNLIYEFDFTPTKLVPLSDSEGAYAAEDENGNRAPVTISYQNPRHLDYGIAIAYPTNGEEMAYVTNVQVICAFCEIGIKEEEEFKSHMDDDDWEPSFNPQDTQTLSKQGFVIPLRGADDAMKRMSEIGAPRDGYAFLASK